MYPFPTFEQLQDLIGLARREDLGNDDVTSRLTIPENAVGVATLIQEESGAVCGLPIVEMVCRCYDHNLRVEPIAGSSIEAMEGRFNDARRTPLLHVRGPMRSLLSAERVILNFIQRTSGVATQTRRYVQRVAGTRARIYDTRKTIPGFRLLDKYAVRCGGGENLRIGLFDGLLIKDNHLATIPLKTLAVELSRVVRQSRDESPDRLVEIEVDTLDQLREVLKINGVDVILLDNMDCPTMEAAVRMRNLAGREKSIALEASGGVTLESVGAIARTGVERISVGALTHSVMALNIGLEIEA